MATPKNKEWGEGYDARYDDELGRSACPYDKDTQQCTDWLSGWDDADTDRMEEDEINKRMGRRRHR